MCYKMRQIELLIVAVMLFHTVEEVVGANMEEVAEVEVVEVVDPSKVAAEAAASDASVYILRSILENVLVDG